MWIQVWDGPRQLWVNEAECYLPNGELAFVNESIPRPLPDWLEALPDSNVRMSADDRDTAGSLLEHRSMRAPAHSTRPTAEYVLSFYRNCIERGGLKVEPDWSSPGLPGRCCPGFAASNAQHHFLVNIYQWRDIAFWTVYLHHKDRRRKTVSVPLEVVKRTPDGITLWIANEKRNCWAPTRAVTTNYPGDILKDLPSQRRDLEVMPSSSLPPWLRFSISDDTPTVLTGRPNGGALEYWSARIPLAQAVDPFLTFERWLNHLDSCGCDASGGSPDHYYLTVWQQGQMLSAQVAFGGEHQGSVSMFYCGEKTINVRYVVKRSVSQADVV
jgi:hypothetical protein